MQDQKQNLRIREIRKRRFTLNIKQKQNLEKIFLSHLQPDFIQKQHRQHVIYGVPTKFRNYIWTQLIPNKHKITHPMYTQLLQQYKSYQIQLGNIGCKNGNREGSQGPENKNAVYHNGSIDKDDFNPQALNQGYNKIMKWLKIIELDIPRTFPQLIMFHKDKQQYEKLSNILGSFSILRSDIGYIQGLSLIGALFLQQLGTQFRAFIALTTIVTTTILYDFYTFNHTEIDSLCLKIRKRIQNESQQIHLKLSQSSFDIKIIIIQWVMTMFSRCFQLDSILMLWDILFAHHISHDIMEQVCTKIFIVRKDVILESEDLENVLKSIKSIKLNLSEEQTILQALRVLPFTQRF